jgi:hypothetical protein
MSNEVEILPLIDAMNVSWIHSLKIIGADWRGPILVPLNQLFVKGCPKKQ